MSAIDWTRLQSAEDRTAEAEAERLAAKRAEAQAHLDATDWYVTRKVEAGKPIPEDVAASREAARAVLSS